MNKRSAWLELAYYVALLALSWMLAQEGPPLRVQFWYYTHRGSQALARTFGQVGMRAELKYRHELGRIHGS